jgi:hypothetical protein
MTEQTHDELQTIHDAAITPLSAKHVLSNNWIAPARTLAIGFIISVVCIFTIPAYSLAYVTVLMPICALTAITQLSLGIIHEIDEHNTRQS